MELLVVIVIIAILAALIFTVLGKTKEQADSTKCASNLRQIGMGIASYCNDHDGQLPGPLVQGQTSIASGGSDQATGLLAQLLAKYLDINPNAATTNQDVRNVLVCPSFDRVTKNLAAPSYIMNFADVMIDYDSQPPFAILGSNDEPVKLTALNNWRAAIKLESGAEQMPLSETWAMKDADRKAFRAPAPTGNFSGLLPKEPVHGEYRNALFYDFHVGHLGMDDRPTK